MVVVGGGGGLVTPHKILLLQIWIYIHCNHNEWTTNTPNPRIRILRIVENGFSLSFFLVKILDKSAGPSSHTHFQFASDAYVI